MSAVKYHVGKFPPPTLDWERLIPLVGPASAAVARYDGVLSAIPNASVLLSPLTTQDFDSIKTWTQEAQGQPNRSFQVTLPTFIRHKIHHPENTTMKDVEYSEEEFRSSIQLMIDLLNNLEEQENTCQTE